MKKNGEYYLNKNSDYTPLSGIEIIINKINSKEYIDTKYRYISNGKIVNNKTVNKHTKIPELTKLYESKISQIKSHIIINDYQTKVLGIKNKLIKLIYLFEIYRCISNSKLNEHSLTLIINLNDNLNINYYYKKI